MPDYSVRIGTRRAKNPVEDHYEIPFRVALDDGKCLLHAGDGPILCPDCKRGHLQWAEAGYVPWHRICDTCGSHWDLHIITWGPARPRTTEPKKVWTGTFKCGHPAPKSIDECDWCVECGDEPVLVYRDEPAPEVVRWIDGQGEVPFNSAEPLGEGVPATWGDLLALVTPEMWATAEADRDRMANMAVVPCAYAVRARFYP